MKPKVLAILREDAYLMERRAALAPRYVKQLIDDGIKVLIQPSTIRAFPIQEYVNAGAIVQEDVSEASLIMSVKKVGIDRLIPNKTYCFASQTIKAQESSMPILDCILERNIRLIDYTKIEDSNGIRLVAVGKFAGIAGVANILHGLGLRLLALGYQTPFTYINTALSYRNCRMLRQALQDVGKDIEMGLMPQCLGPFIFVFTGSGNVSKGAQDAFRELPHEFVDPMELPNVIKNGSLNKVYGTVVSRKDYLRRNDGGDYDAEEFKNHPDRYFSIFAEKIAPYASVIINGIYWDIKSPRLLTVLDAKSLQTSRRSPQSSSSQSCFPFPHRLLAICDISADIRGSIEFMTQCNTILKPFSLYDADKNERSESFFGPGILMCSINNTPTQLPLEAADYFGSLIYPYMEVLLSSDATEPLESHNFPPCIEGAIIASNGHLTPRYKYIEDLRRAAICKNVVH